jgi:hypothetical protein
MWFSRYVTCHWLMALALGHSFLRLLHEFAPVGMQRHEPMLVMEKFSSVRFNGIFC